MMNLKQANCHKLTVAALIVISTFSVVQSALAQHDGPPATTTKIADTSTSSPESSSKTSAESSSKTSAESSSKTSPESSAGSAQESTAPSSTKSRPASTERPTLAHAEINGNKISLELARTRKEVEHGLMERESMPEDHGMVFLFRPSRPERFWMVNCLMSLDMLFIKDGRIVTISEEAPPHRFGPPNRAPLYPAEGPVVVSEVIELNPGYCKRHGIKSGDTVKLTLPDENGKDK